MRNIGLTAVAALLAGTSSVAALDFGNGFSLVGDVELEYFDTDAGSDVTFGLSDLILSWRNQNGGGLGFGVDASVVSLHELDSGEDSAGLYLAAVFGTSFGEFAVGRPRSLLDTMIDTPDIGSSRLISLELGGLNGSFYARSVLLQDGSGGSYGATFKGTSGALTYGLGVHRVEDDGSANFLEGIVTYKTGGAEVYAGYERIGVSGSDIDKLTLGGEYSADRWSFGGQYANLSSGGTSRDLYKLFGDYKVTDALTVGVQYQDQEIPFDAKLYGVSGTYSFGTGFAELGVGRINSSGDTNFGTASIGFRF